MEVVQATVCAAEADVRSGVRRRCISQPNVGGRSGAPWDRIQPKICDVGSPAPLPSGQEASCAESS